MKNDIQNRADIELIVNSFYDKIRQSEALGLIFDGIAKVDWEKHLPKMYSFWEMIVFGKDGYEGHPFRPHLALNNVHQLTPDLFAEWIETFCATVDEHFEGEKAMEVKVRAKNVALSWAYKIDYMNQANAEMQ